MLQILVAIVENSVVLMPRRLGFVMHPSKTALVHDLCDTDQEVTLNFFNYHHCSVVVIHMDT